MRSTLGAGTAALVVAILLTLYASGPSRMGSGKKCPVSEPATVAAFCLADGNGHVTLAKGTNVFQRLKGALTGTP